MNFKGFKKNFRNFFSFSRSKKVYSKDTKGTKNMPINVEEAERVNQDQVILGDRGNQAISESMKKQLTNRPGTGATLLPGQVIRDKNGVVIGKVPMKTDLPKEGRPIPNLLHRGERPAQEEHYGEKVYVGDNQASNNLVPRSSGEPIFNLFTTEESYYFTLELAGLNKETLKISASGDRKLNIECEFIDFSEFVIEKEMDRKQLTKKKKGLITAHKTNIFKDTKYKHTYNFTNPIDVSKLVAEVKEGVLILRCPFKEAIEQEVNITIL